MELVQVSLQPFIAFLDKDEEQQNQSIQDLTHLLNDFSYGLSDLFSQKCLLKLK